MKKLILFLMIFGLFIGTGECGAPSRLYDYSSGSIIEPDEVGANEDGIFTYLQAGVDTIAAGAVGSSELDTLTDLDVTTSSAIDAIDIIQASNAGCIDINKTGSGTGDVVVIENDGTGHGIHIDQDGVLAASKRALYVEGVAQTISPLVYFHLATGSNQTALHIVNAGTGYGIYVDQQTTNSGHALRVDSSTAQTASPLVSFNQDHASSDQATLQLLQDGSGVQISCEGNENLGNNGIWNDRSSFRAVKEDVKDLNVTGYVDKLKNLKMYSFKRKCEIYGNATETILEDIPPNRFFPSGKKSKRIFPKKVKYENPKTHIGYILDDDSTPEELISRDSKGEIAGLSGTQNVNFLLAVCKELIRRIEILEAQ